MTKSNLSLPKIILIIITMLSLGMIISTIAYLLSLKKTPTVTIEPTSMPKISSLPTPELTPRTNVSAWSTYKNDKAGFYLNYPAKWGPIKNEEFRKSVAGKGEEFYSIFTNDSFSIRGNTADFEPYENPLPVYLSGDPLKYCKELEKQVFSAEGCKEINKNIAIISFGIYLELGMFGSGKEISFARQAFINNESNKYAGITISLRFPEYQNNQLDTMSENQIRDIAKNQLSKIDKKNIEVFDQIISTFKFTEK